MKLQWGEPPAKAHRGRTPKYQDEVAQLCEHKGHWAMITATPTNSQASQAVSKLKQHDGIDAVSRKLESGNIGVWAVYDGLTDDERSRKAESGDGS